MYNYIFLVLLKVDKKGDPSVMADVRTKAVAMEHIEAISRQLSEARKLQLRKVFGMKDGWNPLFSLSVDLFRFEYEYLCKVHLYIVFRFF